MQAPDTDGGNTISMEEFEFQANNYTHSQLQKLYKDLEYKRHLSRRT